MSTMLFEERPPLVEFEYIAVEDRNASIASGHYMTKNVAFANVTPAGGKDRVTKDAEQWLNDIERASHSGAYNPKWVEHFKFLYKKFKEGEELPENGIPIKGWPVISPAEQRNLIGVNIRTVEDLAQATEQAIQHFGMGGRTLKEKAIKWLEASQGNGKLVQENAALRAELRDAQSSLKDLGERLSAMEEGKPRRGRPPKEAAA